MLITPEVIKKLQDDTGLRGTLFGQIFAVSYSSVSQWKMGKRIPDTLHQIIMFNLREKIDNYTGEEKIEEIIRTKLITGGTSLFLEWLFSNESNQKC